MKRYSLLFLALLWVGQARAQELVSGNIYATGSDCTTTGACVSTPNADYSAIWLQVTGTFSATIVFEGTVDDATAAAAGLGTYTNVSGTLFSSDPLFVNAGSSDFRLTKASPAINAGTSITASFDFNGRAAPRNGTADIGAHEFDLRKWLPILIQAVVP